MAAPELSKSTSLLDVIFGATLISAVRRHAGAEILTERAISRSIRSSFFPGCVRSMPMARSSEFESAFAPEIHRQYVRRVDITINILKVKRSERVCGSLSQMRD